MPTLKIQIGIPSCLVEFVINDMDVFLYFSIELRILTYTKDSLVTPPLIQHSMHLFHIPVSRVVVINSIRDVIPRSLSPSYTRVEENGTFTKSGRRRRCNPVVARVRPVRCLRFAQYYSLSFSLFLCFSLSYLTRQSINFSRSMRSFYPPRLYINA